MIGMKQQDTRGDGVEKPPVKVAGGLLEILLPVLRNPKYVAKPFLVKLEKESVCVIRCQEGFEGPLAWQKVLPLCC